MMTASADTDPAARAPIAGAVTAEAADPVGAFCRHDRVRIAGTPGGPLAGTTFAAKDLFDVAGIVACCGNPTWRDTHAPAARTAPAITALLDAGATLVGLTITDELALSLTGENHHYGTPLNTRAPDRVPGGSSSGSASAVAAGLADFALGTDTGGSVRVPASHCGLHGFRPTHGAVSTEGVWPLSPRFDTVGWFARDGATLRAVGDALLAPPGAGAPASVPARLLVSDEVLPLLDPDARAPFAAAAAALADRLERRPRQVTLLPHGPDPDAWTGIYLALQNGEAAKLLGPWIASWQPAFGSLIGGRFAHMMAVTGEHIAAAELAAAGVVAAVRGALAGDAWLLWPSAAGAAPPRGLPDADVNGNTGRALALGALAGLAGLPQVSLPVGEVAGCPFGVSLIGPAGSDRALLAAAAALAGPRKEEPS